MAITGQSSQTNRRPGVSNLPHLYARLRRCTTRQRLAVCCFMSDLVNRSHIATVINRVARAYLCCPRCKSRRFCRNGFANGLHRYRCSDCGRTFNALSGTPLARLRLKHKWLGYCECLRDTACTVRSAAEKVGVHPNTSFRWRHRFLQWAKLDRPDHLVGIVEAEGMFLRESKKGNRQGGKQDNDQTSKSDTEQLARAPGKRGGVAGQRGVSARLVNIVVARDRSGATIDFIAGRGALAASALHRRLRPKLKPDVLLVTDANAAYRRFSREAGIDYRAVDVRRGARERMQGSAAIHLQNVSAYHGRFKTWLRHFNGVATRNLDNYLGWRWAIDMGRIASAEGFLRAALCGGRQPRPLATHT